MSIVKKQSSLSLLLVALFLGSTLGFVSNSAWADPVGRDMGVGFCSKHGQYSGSECPGCAREKVNSYNPPAAPTRDYEAERRQQEAAAAAAAAEAAEAERLRVAEAARIKADADKKQADFIRMRDETVSLLKDSGGNSGLKGVKEPLI